LRGLTPSAQAAGYSELGDDAQTAASAALLDDVLDDDELSPRLSPPATRIGARSSHAETPRGGDESRPRRSVRGAVCGGSGSTFVRQRGEGDACADETDLTTWPELSVDAA
jgi:hypothetical protein